MRPSARFTAATAPRAGSGGVEVPEWEYRYPGLDAVTCAPTPLVNHRRVAAGRAIRDLLAALGMPPADHAGRADGFAELVEALDAPATRSALAALRGGAA